MKDTFSSLMIQYFAKLRSLAPSPHSINPQNLFLSLASRPISRKLGTTTHIDTTPAPYTGSNAAIHSPSPSRTGWPGRALICGRLFWRDNTDAISPTSPAHAPSTAQTASVNCSSRDR